VESRLNMSGLGPLYPTVTTSSRSPPKAWTTRISRKVELLLESGGSSRELAATPAGNSPANPHKHGATKVTRAARGPIQAAPAARAASRDSMQKVNFSSKSAFSARVFSEYFRVFSRLFSGKYEKETKSALFARSPGAAGFHATCFWQLEHSGKQPNSRNMCIAPPVTARRDCRPIGSQQLLDDFAG
jgi:hypothetical protein